MKTSSILESILFYDYSMVERGNCLLLDTIYDSQGSVGSSLCGWDGLWNQGMNSFQWNKLAVSTPKTKGPDSDGTLALPWNRVSLFVIRRYW